MKKASILLVVYLLLFFLNGLICDLVTSNVNDWWSLRLAIYSLMFCLLFCVMLLEFDKLSKSLVFFGIIITIGDLVDRVVFDNNQMQINDLAMLLISLTVTYFYYEK